MPKISSFIRRAFSFRLRTLLGVMAVLAIGMGWWTASARRQEAIYKAVYKHGGHATLRDNTWAIVPAGVVELFGRHYFHKLEVVSYYVTTDEERFAGLAEFHQFVREHNLESITWYNVWSRPEGTDVLHKLGGVEKLNFSGPLTPDLIKKISEMPLRTLVMGGGLDAPSIEDLANLRQLKLFDYRGKSVPRAIPVIARLTQLESLSFISSSTPTAAEIREPKPLVKLKKLRLDGGYSPEMIVAIAEQFPALEELILWNLKDPTIVAPLAPHPSLKWIEIGGWEYEHTAPIEKLLPRVRVSYFYE